MTSQQGNGYPNNPGQPQYPGQPAQPQYPGQPQGGYPGQPAQPQYPGQPQGGYPGQPMQPQYPGQQAQQPYPQQQYGGYLPPNGGFTPQQAPKKKGKAGLIIGIVIAVVVIALVAVFALKFLGKGGGGVSSDPYGAGDEFTNTIDTWMHPGYAEGAEAYNPDGNFVGASLDRSIIAYLDKDDALHGVKVEDKSEAWKLEGLDCNYGDSGTIAGTAFCVSDGGKKISMIDLAKGEAKPVAEDSDNGFYRSTVIGGDKDYYILEVEGWDYKEVRGFDHDGKELWKYDVGEDNYPSCALTKGAVICYEYDNWVATLNASDGKPKLDKWTPQLSEWSFEMLADGFIIKDTDKSVNTYYDLDGKVTAEDALQDIPLQPSASQRFLVTSDFAKADHVVNMVLANGTILLDYSGSGAYTIATTGTSLSSDDFSYSYGCSKDGKYILMSDADDKNLIIVNDKAEKLQTIEPTDDTLADVIANSFIVVDNGPDKQTIYLPKGKF